MDEPLDSSGAEEAIERLAGNKQDPPVIQAALWFKERGFDVIPVKTGGKDPTSDRWESAIKNDPRVFLRNPGTQNYGLLPPPGVVILDVDGEVPTFLHRLGEELGHNLPTTMTNASPHGLHVMYRWPKDLPRPKGPWWGKVVARWNFEEGERAGRGYVVGPGSKLADGGEYRRWLKEDIADLPVEWAQSVLSWRTPKTSEPPEGLFEVGDHYVMPEVVEEGGRYEAIRDYSAHLYNRGFNKDERWAQVLMTLVPRFAVPKKPSDVRADFERSNAEMEERLGPPAALPSRDNVIQFPPLVVHSTTRPEERFVHMDTLMAELVNAKPTPFILDRMVVQGGLNLMGGHPKTGKSLAALQMGAAYAAGQDFLGLKSWTGGIPIFLYLTQEGSRAEMLKRLQRVEAAFPGVSNSGRFRISFLNPLLFDKAGYEAMTKALDEVVSEFSAMPTPLSMWLCIDPMRDAMRPEWDENEAKDMANVKNWCRALLTQYPDLTISLIHHLRKSAQGDTGAELAGSGATWGMADSITVWKGKHTTIRTTMFERIVMSGTFFSTTRGEEPAARAWVFDPVSGMMEKQGSGVVEDAESGEVAAYAKGWKGILDFVRDTDRLGASVGEVAEALGMKPDSVRATLSRLRRESKVVQVEGRWFSIGFSPSEKGGMLDEDDADLPPDALHTVLDDEDDTD